MGNTCTHIRYKNQKLHRVCPPFILLDTSLEGNCFLYLVYLAQIRLLHAYATIYSLVFLFLFVVYINGKILYLLFCTLLFSLSISWLSFHTVHRVPLPFFFLTSSVLKAGRYSAVQMCHYPASVYWIVRLFPVLQLIPHVSFLCTSMSVGLIPGGKLYGFLMLLNIAKLLFIKVVLIYIPASSVSLALSSPALYYLIF